jgi:hypothetical protein
LQEKADQSGEGAADGEELEPGQEDGEDQAHGVFLFRAGSSSLSRLGRGGYRERSLGGLMGLKGDPSYGSVGCQFWG